MSDSYSIQQVGGTELAQHYPDRGLIPDVNWHRAVLNVEQKAKRFWGMFGKFERFIAVVSANADGLRIFVALDKFAIFIPWAELTVAAERSTPGTAVRLRTAAVPSVSLELYVDDRAADELFRGVMPPLPQRDPPGRLAWPQPWAVAVLVVVMLVSGGVLASLHLSGAASVAAAVVVAIGIASLWLACRPFIKED